MTSIIVLLFAVIFEVLGTTCMKLSNGFTVLWPSIMMVVFYIMSFTLFVYCIRRIEISIAYAIWTALGMLMITVVGIIFFHESISWLKVGCLLVISSGVIGLSLDVVDK